MDEKKTISENETAELSLDELNAVAGGRGGGHHEPPKATNSFAGKDGKQEKNGI